MDSKTDEHVPTVITNATRGKIQDVLDCKTQNSFSILTGLTDDEGDQNGGAVFSDGSEDWSEVPTSARRKRHRISTGGRSGQVNTDDYMKLSIDEKLSILYDDIQTNKGVTNSIEQKIDKCLSLHNKVTQIEDSLETFDSRLLLLEYKSVDIEARSRRKNLLFNGFPESRGEDCCVIIQSLVHDKMKVERGVVIDRAHRLGKYKRGSDRTIIVAFRDYTDVQAILSNVRYLKGSDISINKDLPKEITKARKELWGQYKDLRAKFPSSKVSMAYPAKIILDGKKVADAFPYWDTIMRGDRVSHSKHGPHSLDAHYTGTLGMSSSQSMARPAPPFNASSPAPLVNKHNTDDEDNSKARIARRQSRSPTRRPPPRSKAPERNKQRSTANSADIGKQRGQSGSCAHGSNSSSTLHERPPRHVNQTGHGVTSEIRRPWATDPPRRANRQDPADPCH